MKKRKWHKGPPPSIGWWPASIDRDPESIRWWNGKYWSYPSYPDYPDFLAASRAAMQASAKEEWIQWTDRWWL
jgi:hypothetical protein